MSRIWRAVPVRRTKTLGKNEGKQGSAGTFAQVCGAILLHELMLKGPWWRGWHAMNKLLDATFWLIVQVSWKLPIYK